MSKVPENQSVTVPVYLRGKLIDDLDFKVGFWSYGEDEERKVWGLLHLDYPTQMCYGFDYAPPKEALIKVREKHPDFPWWSFDAGRQLYVKLDDLELAFKALNIWTDE